VHLVTLRTVSDADVGTPSQRLQAPPGARP
jgi:hypothetical protein